MADSEKRLDSNVAGNFYVDASPIDIKVAGDIGIESFCLIRHGLLNPHHPLLLFHTRDSGSQPLRAESRKRVYLSHCNKQKPAFRNPMDVPITGSSKVAIWLKQARGELWLN